jgi:hypothetical protein
METLNTLTFGGSTAQIGLFPESSWLFYLEEIALSSSISIRGLHPFGSFCLFVSPPGLGTEIFMVQSCILPVYRLPRL